MVSPDNLSVALGDIATLAQMKAEDAHRTYRQLTLAGAKKSARDVAYKQWEKLSYFSVVTQEALEQSTEVISLIA